MTATDRLERDLAEWFGETAAPRTPDWTDDILRQTAPMRQRPRWTFPERWLPMSVTTLGKQALRPAPWGTIALLAALILLIVAAVVLYAGSQRRVPPPFGPAENGSIAFVKPPDGYSAVNEYVEPFGDIQAVDPVTGMVTTLVGGPEADGVPAYSLDGTRLSFVRQVKERASEPGLSGISLVGGDFELFALDARGGTPVRLTRDPLPGIREQAWSPDGRSVAFTVPAAGGRSDLWIAATDGSGARKLALGVSAIMPKWRPPDGRELLFVGSASPGLDKLGAYHGIYGEEGATGLGLYRVRPDGSGLTAITSPIGRKYDYVQTSWTPDGERIVTQQAGEDDYMRVVVLTAEGREVGRFGSVGI
jgi:hypothetical protein